MNPPPLPPTSGRDLLPHRTTPTWEMELLISGATVFSLLQVPRLMDQMYYSLVPRLDAAYQPLATMPYLYLMTACLALILTFLLHLCVRGYWVALVGLMSVYPRGVDWDSLPWGPAFVKALRRRTPPQEEIIERYDNRASQVFGFGMGLAYLALGIALLVILLIAGVVALHELSQRRWDVDTLLLGSMAVIFAPYLLLYLIDGWLGRRRSHFPRLTRGLEVYFDYALRSRLLQVTNYPLLLFSGHAGGHRGTLMMSTALLLLIGLAAVRMAPGSPFLHLDGYGLFPSESNNGRTLDPGRYADQRERLDNLQPSVHIPSERIQGDWLRVFIPLNPTRDSAALLQACPHLAQADTAASDAVLDCMPQHFRLSINGAAVPAATFDFARDPIQGLRGVVTMLDIQPLPRGRHVLMLEESHSASADAPTTPATAEQDADTDTIRIPFWR